MQFSHKTITILENDYKVKYFTFIIDHIYLLYYLTLYLLLFTYVNIQNLIIVQYFIVINSEIINKTLL